jgi:hypothetical protein
MRMRVKVLALLNRPITECIRHINPKEQAQNCLCELREPHCMATVGWVFVEA